MDLWRFDDRQKFVVGLWFRVVCASVFLVYLGAARALELLGPFEASAITFSSLIALLSVNLIYWLVGKKTAFDIREFYVHWIIDIALISGVLYGLGPLAESVAISAFTLIIVTSATFISRSAAMIVAAMSSAALAIGSPEFVHAGDDRVGMGAVFFVWASGSLFFGLIAFLAGTLAKALGDVNALLEGRNEELATRNRELAELQEELEFQANVVAHDIRGPVGAAAAAMDMVYGPSIAGDEEHRDPLIGMALENLKRVDGMIDRLTEVRELKQGNLRHELVDWTQLIDRLRVEFAVVLQERAVRIEVMDPLPMIMADLHYMTVLMRNAIGNALRYVPDDGSGLIRVSGSSREACVEIAVSDNGVGLPEANTTELFRMFRKGDGDSRAGAMGVGLALARRVVERHQGDIWFGESELGGATLRFRLSTGGAVSETVDAGRPTDRAP